MREIKVSVIIPVYQVENFLERAIDSVLDQTLEEKEIILVDDGSEDDSPRICDEYKARYPELISVIHKENEGLGYARNSGVAKARGEYIAFLDSDDTIEPTMLEEMYEKAVDGDYEIVMCDVNIIYVDEGKNVVSYTYSDSEIDISEYLIKGNNITYSVNKLYKRDIWRNLRYEQMLFEDIALIPALVTKCTHIGYVKKAFYNYYRRSNTISTSVIGKMVDITDAFRKFIDGSNPLYREEVVYCVAKQLMWNMTKSRIVFQANFIDLLNEYKSDFLLNSYIERDQEIKKLLQFMDKDIIPNNIICIDLKRELSEVVLNEIMSNFPEAKLIIIEKNIGFEDIPECVERAWEEGNIKFVEEYLSLRVLYEKGGIVLDKNTFPQLQLRKARLNKIFFGFENSERITTGCFGAQINHYVIKSILTSYEEDNIYNQALLPLAERIRDFLIIHFNLKVNGRKQLLKGEVQIYLPSVLAFDMKDQENYCKKYFANIPVGYEMIDEDTLRMWSSRIMENWNLYKQELAKKNKVVKKVEVKNTGYTEEYVQNIIHEVMNNYEKSTCWKITKPLRIISQIFRKEKVK